VSGSTTAKPTLLRVATHLLVICDGTIWSRPVDGLDGDFRRDFAPLNNGLNTGAAEGYYVTRHAFDDRLPFRINEHVVLMMNQLPGENEAGYI